jgi:hypothetical protein
MLVQYAYVVVVKYAYATVGYAMLVQYAYAAMLV